MSEPLTNKERFLAGHNFFIAKDGKNDVYHLFKSTYAHCVFKKDNRYKNDPSVLIGSIDKTTLTHVHMASFLMGNRVTFRVKFADMVFIESEVTA